MDRRLVLIAALCASLPLASRAAPVRAQVTVQASQLEVAAIVGHLDTRKMTTDADRVVSDRIEAHLGAAEVRAKIKSKAEALSAKRTQRSLASEDLGQLIKWLTPATGYPVASDVAPVIAKLRTEFQEVAKGNNPYPLESAPKMARPSLAPKKK